MVAVVLVVLVALSAAGCSGDRSTSATPTSAPGSPAPTTSRTPTAPTAPTTPASGIGSLVDLRPLSVQDGVIVDDRGRQVLLRGANVNGLGDYYQADRDTAPAAPVTDRDWDAMARRGLSVVRLIMSWSLLEPERGRIDRDYLRRVRDAVDAANRRGLYVVLDMHQDAWGKDIATPAGVTCPAGTEAAIGWDGAPAWATLTGDASTCRSPGSRESAPAVQAAFANFYANADGIRDRLVAVWGAVAAEFADEPGVAGYDLFNEPNPVPPAEASQQGYNRFVADAIAAVRAAEQAAGSRATPVFVEPIVSFPLPGSRLDPAVVQDPNLVFAPHNYAESIGPKVLTVEQTFDVDRAGADELGAPGDPAALWIGEYGFWSTSPETLEVAGRYAAAEDARALGGAWWQWRQTCGDPHSIGKPVGTATEDQVHLITRACPGDTDARETEEFLRILGRAAPRFTPGRIAELRSDPATGAMMLRSTGATLGGELVVWLPDVAGRDVAPPITGPPIRVVGLDEPQLVAVPGGRILTALATAPDFTLVVGDPG